MKNAVSSEYDTMRETCLGLPLVEERVLLEDERMVLGETARHSLKRSLGWGCVSPVLFLAFVMTLASITLDSDSSLVQMGPAIVFILATVGLVAFFMLRTEGHYKSYKAVKQDLRNGHIAIYQGLAPGIEIPEIDVIPPPTGKIADVEFSLFAPITLEVFSGSRRLWRVNGTVINQLIVLPAERTAPLPELAKTTAKWVEPARVVAANTLDISQSGRRDLSREEQNEIRQRARTVWRKPAIGAFLFTAYFGGFAVMQWVAKSSVRLEWSAYIFIALTLWININFAKVAWWAWRLSRDVSNGFVVIIRYPDVEEKDGNYRKGPVIEWLPVSKSNWSINGDPAPWRLRG